MGAGGLESLRRAVRIALGRYLRSRHRQAVAGLEKKDHLWPGVGSLKIDTDSAWIERPSIAFEGSPSTQTKKPFSTHGARTDADPKSPP